MQKCAVVIKYAPQSPPAVVVGIAPRVSGDRIHGCVGTVPVLDKTCNKMKLALFKFLELKFDDSLTFLIALSLGSS